MIGKLADTGIIGIKNDGTTQSFLDFYNTL